MRAGVALPQYMIDVEGGVGVRTAMARMARAADTAGLDAVWLSDHPFVTSPDGMSSGALEPFVAAAAVARATERVRVGTLVLAATMRAPALAAHAFRTLAAAAPGRIVAGLGAGWYEAEHRAFGVPLPGYAARVERLEQAMWMIAALGRPRPKLLCGGTGARILSLAARSADAWNVAWDASPEDFAKLNRRLDEACEVAGRDPHTLARTVGLTLLVARDERGLERAVERLRGRAAFLRSLDRRALAERIVCGTPEACAERIARYGADEVVAALLLRDDTDMLELFASEVAPHLRA